MARQTSRRKTKEWSDYEVPNFESADVQTMRDAVRKAAKAANQRLVRLERAGYTKGIYATAVKQIDEMRPGKKRFKEYTTKMTLNELRKEYVRLRNFLSAKTSTVAGRKATDRKRYETAVERGYKGTMDDFYDEIERVFVEKQEALFSSDLVFGAMLAGNTDVVEAVMRMHEKDKNMDEGKALKEFLRLSREKKAKQQKQQEQQP